MPDNIRENLSNFMMNGAISWVSKQYQPFQTVVQKLKKSGKKKGRFRLFDCIRCSE